MRLTGRSGKQGVFAISTRAWYMFYTIQEIWILRDCDNSDKFRFEIVFLTESDLLLNISHYTNCATGRSHASTVWPKKKSRLWLQIQILKLLLTIKLTQGSSRHIWWVRAFQLIFQDIPHHVVLESFQRIFLGINSFLVSW
jgi:hypothetical protein